MVKAVIRRRRREPLCKKTYMNILKPSKNFCNEVLKIFLVPHLGIFEKKFASHCAGNGKFHNLMNKHEPFCWRFSTECNESLSLNFRFLFFVAILLFIDEEESLLSFFSFFFIPINSKKLDRLDAEKQLFSFFLI